MSKALVLGASGATGSLLVKQLLVQGTEVIALVRSASAAKDKLPSHDKLKLVELDISSCDSATLLEHLVGCHAVFSCLGHNLSFKGIYGQPRKLVLDAMRKVVSAIEAQQASHTMKLLLMNTTGNANRDIPEVPPLSQRVVVGLLRALLPPHTDNEAAADYLRLKVGQDHPLIEWVAVRPDGLVDQQEVSEYHLHASPIRNAIFDAGSTSRINVAHFMAQLSQDQALWQQWRGQMPVIYNQDD